MALQDLDTETMLLLSGEWTDPQKDRPKLESIALSAALIWRIDTVHAELVLARAGVETSAIDARIAHNRAAVAALEERHDRKLRGSQQILTALAELADDLGDAGHFLHLRDHLWQQALSVGHFSYTDEEGNTEVVWGRLDAATRAALKKVKTVKGLTLDDEVTVWLDATRLLGKLEQERARHEADKAAAVAAAAASATPNELGRARKAWASVAGALVSMLALADEEDAALAATILVKLDAEHAKTERRAAAQRMGPLPSPPPLLTTGFGATAAPSLAAGPEDQKAEEK